MDKNQIGAAALTLSSPGVPFGDENKARKVARAVNERLADYVARYPTRIAAFATLPLPDIDGALEEHDYAVKILKLDGVGVMSNYGQYSGTPDLDPLLEALDSLGCPIHVRWL